MAQKILCTVTEMIDHGDHVYSVLLRPQGKLPRFAAGQFLHLALDPFRPGDFWPESRVFSIASTPSQPSILRITFAAKGAFTTRMEREICPGRELWVKMPYGEFVIDSHKDVCLAAGGTGITAFTAFLSQLPAEHPKRVLLFYGARCSSLLVYRALVEEAAQRCRNLRVYQFVESAAGFDGAFRQGRLDVDNVWNLLPDPPFMSWYIAGPPGMVVGLTSGLKSRGLKDWQILVDGWE